MPSQEAMGTGARGARIRTLLRRASSWTALSLLLNLAWEAAQLPLYTIWRDASAAYIAYAVLHCTVMDGIIAGISFVLAGALLRDPDWVYAAPRAGGAITVVLGVGYTALSEWRNVYQLGNWAYSSAMPLVFGIGLSPLLQWIVVPAAGIVLLRFFRRRRTPLH